MVESCGWAGIDSPWTCWGDNSAGQLNGYQVNLPLVLRDN
jgi:hypothetical protein